MSPKSKLKVNAPGDPGQNEASGDSVIVTAQGEPALEVARLRIANRPPLDVLHGSVVLYADSTAPVDVEWGSAQ